MRTCFRGDPCPETMSHDRSPSDRRFEQPDDCGVGLPPLGRSTHPDLHSVPEHSREGVP